MPTVTVKFDDKADNKIEMMEVCDQLWENDPLGILNQVIKDEGSIKTEFYDEVNDQEDDNDIFECDICGDLFDTTYKLELHKGIHIEKQKTDKKRKSSDKKKSTKIAPKLKDIGCKMCNLNFTYQDNFVQHCKDVHDTQYSCDLCEFTNKERLLFDLIFILVKARL